MASKISIRSIAFIIALLGAVWAWMVHSSNLSYYQKSTGFGEVDMILTADDASYIAPAINYKKRGVWKDNSEGVSAFIQRPPMIGIINWVLLYINDSGNYQKYVASILHGWALFLFGIMGMQWLGKRAGLVIQLLYAILPCFWGYLFYFLTESVTPSLLVFLLYGYYKFQQTNSPKWILLQGFIMGVILLTRPQLVIIILPFFYFLWTYVKNKFHNKWLTVLTSLILAFGSFALWQIRSTRIAGEWKGIHPIYATNNISEYRPVHRSFGNLFRVWEHNSQIFHTTMGIFGDRRMMPDEWVDQALTNVPSEVYHYVNEDYFKNLFLRYNDHIQIVYQTKPVQETEKEYQLRKDVDQVTATLRTKMWKKNYITTPAHSIQWMFTKSQLNLLIFQKKYRGQWWMEGLRYFCVAMIALITLLSISQIMNRKNKMFLLMALGIIAYLFYLFFIQKMNEERYLMPLLPVFLFLAAERIQTILKKINNQKHANP